MQNPLVKANIEKHKRNVHLTEELGIELHGGISGIGLFCKRSDKYLRSFSHGRKTHDEVHNYLLKIKQSNSSIS